MSFWWEYGLGVLGVAAGFVLLLTLGALIMSAWDKATWKKK